MNNIVIKKFGSNDNSIICFLNNDIYNLRLNFAEIYNNGYNTNNFNVYNNDSFGSFDNSLCDTKFNYINDNIKFFSFLTKITEIYNKLNYNYMMANYYIKNAKKHTNDFIITMDKIGDYYELLENTLKSKANFHHSKITTLNILLKQLKDILNDIKINKISY